jgi:hypothetical protein
VDARPSLLALVCAGCLVDNPAYQQGSTGPAPGTTTSPTSGTTDAPAPTTTGATTTGTTTGATTGATSTGSVDPTDATTTGAFGLDLPGDWWDPAFTRRRRLWLLHDGEAPLQGFPVALVLDPAEGRVDYDEVADDGHDLRFVDGDHTTVLAHEVERWGEPGRSWLWVRVPEVVPGGEDFIWMYWGAPGAPDGADPAAVWADDFAAVYHLHEPPGDGVVARDVVGGLDGEYLGGMQAEDLVDGRFAGGLEFDGVDDALRLDADLVTDAWTGLTLEAWVYHHEYDDERVLCRSPAPDVQSHVFSLGLFGNGRVRGRVGSDDEGGLTDEYTTQDGDVPLDTWTHVAFTWSAAAGQVVIHVDGEDVLTAPHPGATIKDSQQRTVIANINDTAEDRFFDGVLDEVRISRVARDGAWLRAHVRATRDEFVEFGPPEGL